ncbi:hypothetical protein LXL04_033012 [Taraxacum kok-saghyz]
MSVGHFEDDVHLLPYKADGPTGANLSSIITEMATIESDKNGFLAPVANRASAVNLKQSFSRGPVVAVSSPEISRTCLFSGIPSPIAGNRRFLSRFLAVSFSICDHNLSNLGVHSSNRDPRSSSSVRLDWRNNLVSNSGRNGIKFGKTGSILTSKVKIRRVKNGRNSQYAASSRPTPARLSPSTSPRQPTCFATSNSVALHLPRRLAACYSLFPRPPGTPPHSRAPVAPADRSRLHPLHSPRRLHLLIAAAIHLQPRFLPPPKLKYSNIDSADDPGSRSGEKKIFGEKMLTIFKTGELMKSKWEEAHW